MGKELNAVLEIVNNVAETRIDSEVVKLDELALAYIGGGEGIVLM